MAGGGIMEAALLGAAVGGGTSLVTGEDPLKGALMGGLTGGAFSGIGSALGAAGSAGTQAATQTAAAQSGAGLISSVPGTTGASMLTDVATNTLPQVASVVPESFGGMSNAALTQGAGINTLAQPVTEQIATQVPNTMTADLTGAGAGGGGGGGIRDMLSLKPDSLASKGLDWWDKQDTLTQAGIGGIGLMGANAYMNPYEPPIPEKYKSKLAGYNRDTFTPSTPQQPIPYYQAQYAEGGIAALAGPQGGMYPQSQQANTQYATPTQMPTSAEVVNSDYEAQTNPYTGEPVGYAMGGDIGGAGGMSSGRANQIGMGSIALGGMQSIPSVNQAASNNGAANFNPAAFRQGQAAQDAMVQPQSNSHIYRPQYGQQVAQPQAQGMVNNMMANTPAPMNAANGQSGLGAMGGGKGAMGQMLMDKMGNNGAANFNPSTFRQGQAAQEAQQPQAQSGAQVYRPQYAAGGSIDNYSLGGYAHGGNPRLLDGPGDGMSDSIPATIGNKQPARLAAGEFVIPADVVSHLGNGSTDAGAKHLYSMMDKIRKARTGNSKQGKQINANRFLPQQG